MPDNISYTVLLCLLLGDYATADVRPFMTQIGLLLLFWRPVNFIGGKPTSIPVSRFPIYVSCFQDVVSPPGWVWRYGMISVSYVLTEYYVTKCEKPGWHIQYRHKDTVHSWIPRCTQHDMSRNLNKTCVSQQHKRVQVQRIEWTCAHPLSSSAGRYRYSSVQ